MKPSRFLPRAEDNQGSYYVKIDIESLKVKLKKIQKIILVLGRRKSQSDNREYALDLLYELEGIIRSQIAQKEGKLSFSVLRNTLPKTDHIFQKR